MFYYFLVDGDDSDFLVSSSKICSLIELSMEEVKEAKRLRLTGHYKLPDISSEKRPWWSFILSPILLPPNYGSFDYIPIAEQTFKKMFIHDNNKYRLQTIKFIS